MRFVVLVAADLYGNKVNLELAFPSFPTLADLYRLVDTTFAVESSSLRPAGHPFIPFKATRFQLFDDRAQAWTELTSANQLVEYAQLYAFQRDVAESQKQIPLPRLPATARVAVPPPSAPPPSQTSPGRHVVAAASYAAGNSPSPSGYVATPSVRDTASPPRSLAQRPAVAPTAAAVAPTAAAVGGKFFPENPTFEQKVRLTFEEIDANQNRVIEHDEFRRAMRVLNIDLNATMLADLFQRADNDRDSVISFSEFQAFAINYPTFLDSLYFRSKEFWEEHRKKQNIEAHKAALDEAKHQERSAAQIHADARADLEALERKLVAQEQDLQAKLLRERDCRAASLEARKEVERQQYERAEREREVASCREKERNRHAAVVESRRVVEVAERRLSAQHAELERAVEKERQVEALLAECRKETERQQRAAEAASEDLAQTKEREQVALASFADVQREVQRLLDDVAAADKELSRRIEGERVSEATLSESQRETARAAHRRDEDERELSLQKEREAQLARMHHEALRSIEDAERAVRQLEQEHADYLLRRQQIEQQELPLLEQEIRLREQRFMLEEKEMRLKNEAASFQNVSGRFRHGDDGYRAPSQRANVSPPRRNT